MVQGAGRFLAGRRRPEVVDEDGLEAVLDGEADALHVVYVVHVVALLEREMVTSSVSMRRARRTATS